MKSYIDETINFEKPEVQSDRNMRRSNLPFGIFQEGK
jgi:hypothetical protein